MGRVVLFGMQATGFLFTLTSLTDPFGCLELFLPTLVAFAEAFGRFYVICNRGDILCNAVSDGRSEIEINFVNTILGKVSFQC